MSRLFILFLLIGLIAALTLTNPNRDAFADFVEENVADRLAAETADLPAGDVLGDLGGLAAGRLVRSVAQRDNYIVASVYTLDLDGRTREADDWTFLGIGSHFFELHRPERFRD